MATNFKSSGVVAVCILSLVIGTVESRRRDYNGFTVLRCNPNTIGQIEKLQKLMLQMAEKGEEGKLQFWKEPVGTDRSVDISVDPEYIDTLHAKLKMWDLRCETMIEDLGKAIRESSPTTVMTRTQLSNSTMEAQSLSPHQYHLEYHRYHDIEAKLQELSRNDHRVSLSTIGQSTEGRNLYLVKISSNPAANKPVIFIDAGHHAREWITHSTIIYLMEALLGVDVPLMSRRQCARPKCRQSVRGMLDLDKYDYFFVPAVNPDGYEYSHTTDRLWRKTRSSRYCKGADPNRNYPFHWGESGVSQFSCADTYAGTKPMSEPEIRAMVKVLDAHKSRIAMYISLHSYSQLILAPYGYARLKPSNYPSLERVANTWIRSISELRNTNYRFGTSAILLYPAAGCSDDYAYGAAGIKYSYTIELPDTGARGFVLPPSEIIPVGQEAVVGLSAMINELKNLSTKRVKI